jgi:hypothetical protein
MGGGFMRKYIVVERELVSHSLVELPSDRIVSQSDCPVSWADACRIALEISAQQPNREFAIFVVGDSSNLCAPLAVGGVLSDDSGDAWPVDVDGRFTEPR